MDFADATVDQCVVWIDDLAGDEPLVGGRSRLFWVLREFVRYGVTDFLLLADPAAAWRVPASLAASLAASLPRPVRIALASPPAGSGSGGALAHARDQLRERFLWCRGSQ